VCCTVDTVHLHSRVLSVRQIDPKLTLWLGSLAALAAFNVGLWIWLAGSVSLNSSYVVTQLVLSGVYVAVCGFRSLFPRVDLERACLWDSWLSTILLGRTAATVAELCFALQCSLFVHRLADITGMPLLEAVAYTFVPLVIVAELFCWYAVLTLNHVGHALEESLWALLMLMLSVVLGTAAFAAQGPLRVMLIAGFVVYGVGAGLTMAFDVRMYIRRWRLRAAGIYLTITTGWHDSQYRRHPTLAWAFWREEVPWMTLYFSIGVWTSLAMVLL
jgi:hypothetical protein